LMSRQARIRCSSFIFWADRNELRVFLLLRDRP
jgi:hypothetical protein